MPNGQAFPPATSSAWESKTGGKSLKSNSFESIMDLICPLEAELPDASPVFSEKGDPGMVEQRSPVHVVPTRQGDQLGQQSGSMTALAERIESVTTPLPTSKSLFDQDLLRPAISYSYKQATLKGEDKALVATDLEVPGVCGLKCHVFAVFDGHNGGKTAKYCKDNLLDELLPRLPMEKMPPESRKEEFQGYMDQLQKAMMDTFLSLNRKSIGADCASGCTASVMLVTGWLVTVANVGDSAVLIDTHTEVKELTSCHRLDDNELEVARLRKAGYVVAALRADLKGPALNGEPGYGPLRAWPGAVMMARAIGDSDAGVTVLAYPHVTQVKIPDTGARFILASDGVWDSKVSQKQVVKIMRQNRLQKAASAVVRRVLSSTGLADDTTALCVDILPPGVGDFSEQHGTLSFWCFANPKANVNDEDTSLHTFCIVNTAETVPENYLAHHHAKPSGEFARNRIYSVKKSSSTSSGDSNDMVVSSRKLTATASISGLAVFSSDSATAGTNTGDDVKVIRGMASLTVPSLANIDTVMEEDVPPTTPSGTTTGHIA
eukprot:CAMPEP_0177762566 /NCGR_PEP_ID=MMETSP0491_2-20121128/6413_1 /TAXON_ID=63592 /ORGANISM="Tetraselmis chuii, Strain PLY429" /LENGTH=547 /DNA_ID=CAMNT_0019278629 /DNA_START=37 /DNA_END=1680 /DNA_ORIENTATION=+